MTSLVAFIAGAVPSLFAAAVVYAFDDAALRGMRRPARFEAFSAE